MRPWGREPSCEVTGAAVGKSGISNLRTGCKQITHTTCGGKQEAENESKRVGESGENLGVEWPATAFPIRSSVTLHHREVSGDF